MALGLNISGLITAVVAMVAKDKLELAHAGVTGLHGEASLLGSCSPHYHRAHRELELTRTRAVGLAWVELKAAGVGPLDSLGWSSSSPMPWSSGSL